MEGQVEREAERRAGRAAGSGSRRYGSPNARALAIAVSGLVLAGTMVVASLPPSDPGAAEDSVDAAGGDLTRRMLLDQVDDAPGEIGAVAEPEVCDDGRNPAESYAPDGIDGEAVQRIQDADQLVVGVDQNSYRWGYREPDTGDIVGFDIDLVRAIGEDLLGPNPDIVFKAIPTAQRIPAIQSGDVDMVVRSMSITCDRWDDVAFSAAYFETGQQLLAPVNSGIDGVNESLNGTTVCSGEDTTAETELRARTQALDVELITRGNHLDCLVAIQLGQADALMTDSALAAGHAAQDPTVHLVGEPITVESYGVAMNLEDVDLVRRVNEVLQDYTTGGAWAESYADWLAAYLPEGQSTAPEPLYLD
ncbi:glutamate ABC transporter substrate-binding protein [Streptomyces sp. B6B3]|uniref:glutamate ABC transporter substrate-binding protein n=1 Tax=Streptomyces sp. B6B3 TaxID=3153570 RepID=UPI00325D0752